MNPYLSFKNNIFNAFHLYGRVFTQKFSKADIKLTRAMYITYLVSCLESYFVELFKEMFNKKLIDEEIIFEIKSIKNLRFSLKDLQEIENKKESIADVLAENMNFQNINCIYEFAKSIQFNKYSEKVKENLNINSKGKDILDKYLEPLSKQKRINSNNLIVSKAVNKIIVEYMGEDKIIARFYSNDQCFNTIREMIKLRHQVVHKAKKVKIEHGDIWGYTIATFQLANMFNRIYEFKANEEKQKRTIPSR